VFSDHVRSKLKLNNAIHFLNSVQDQKCDGNYAVIEIGDGSYGGGFASQFQLAALYWLRTASYHNYTIPILIRGHIRSYSDGMECLSVNHDWTCFFLPLSSCQLELLSKGSRITSPMKSSEDQLIPPQFEGMGLAWWWGVVQLYMFRLQPHIEQIVLHEASKMNDGRGFPFHSLIAGLHVRHGDKTVDGWRLHSFENEMAAVRKSPDCVLEYSTIQSSNISNISSSTIDPNKHFRIKQGICHPNIVNVTDIKPEDRELNVFVASDDPQVLQAAHQLGHLVDTTGVSQKTGNTGMFVTLQSHPEYGYNATIEIITDIYFLSKCSTLVGTAASQVFRLAVDISFANGTLNCAIALDYAQLSRIRRMSAKYELIVPENFQSP
jgi:hypothetical protein